jgi:putative intracellular protease/amidase
MNAPSSRHVLCVAPDNDFDPTELAVPWLHLRAAGHRVTCATLSGARPAADERLLARDQLGPFSFVLRTTAAGCAAYAQVSRSAAFLTPIPLAQVEPDGYDGILLSGGYVSARWPGDAHAFAAAFRAAVESVEPMVAATRARADGRP